MATTTTTTTTSMWMGSNVFVYLFFFHLFLLYNSFDFVCVSSQRHDFTYVWNHFFFFSFRFHLKELVCLCVCVFVVWMDTYKCEFANVHCTTVRILYNTCSVDCTRAYSHSDERIEKKTVDFLSCDDWKIDQFDFEWRKRKRHPETLRDNIWQGLSVNSD